MVQKFTLKIWSTRIVVVIICIYLIIAVLDGMAAYYEHGRLTSFIRQDGKIVSQQLDHVFREAEVCRYVYSDGVSDGVDFFYCTRDDTCFDVVVFSGEAESCAYIICNDGIKTTRRVGNYSTQIGYRANCNIGP